MLAAAGWAVQDRADTNVHAALGVAVCEVPTADGRADYLPYVDTKLVGAIEAKREGTSLTGVDVQTARYAEGLDAGQRLAAWRAPLPFRYESTATETQFSNALDPIVRPRRVFSFHRPGTLARWMRAADDRFDAPTLRARLRRMPELVTKGLRDAQVDAITGLERSLAADHPRALIQMATGAGKTFTMVADDEVQELPPPDVIAQEIVEDLQAALDEFAAVAEALQLAKAPHLAETPQLERSEPPPA